MVDSSNTQVLAIDGGGTRCRIALASAETRVVVNAGPANVFSDFDGAMRSIRSSLGTLAEKAVIPLDRLISCPAFVGLAGVTSAAVAARVRAALPLSNVEYAEDRPAALQGALGDVDGIVAHCGTGSFFAGQIKGQRRFAGGWGAQLGDEASAQWVGRRAASLSLQSVDGFVAQTPLLANLLRQFKGADRLLEFASNATAEAFGALAPMVTEAADCGDAVAVKIMQTGADYISTGLDHMGWAQGVQICLTGGIGPRYARFLPPQKQSNVRKPLGTPLDGAISLAMLRRKECPDGRR